MFVPWGTAGVLALAFGGTAAWGWALKRRFRGEPVFDGPPAPAIPPWALFAGAAGYVVPATVAAGLLGGEAPADRLRAAAVAAGGSAAAVAALWLAFAGTRREPRGPWPDVRDGAAAFLLALPAVVGLMALTATFRSVEGGNPLLQSIVAEPAPAAWAWLVASAVVFAPVGEELLFRGLILGSLRSAGLPARLGGGRSRRRRSRPCTRCRTGRRCWRWRACWGGAGCGPGRWRRAWSRTACSTPRSWRRWRWTGRPRSHEAAGLKAGGIAATLSARRSRRKFRPCPSPPSTTSSPCSRGAWRRSSPKTNCGPSWKSPARPTPPCG